MAFDRTKFQRVGGAGQKLFIYNSDDSFATITAADYFDGIENEVDKGDVILVVSALSGTPAIDPLVITSARGAATTTTGATEN